MFKRTMISLFVVICIVPKCESLPIETCESCATRKTAFSSQVLGSESDSSLIGNDDSVTSQSINNSNDDYGYVSFDPLEVLCEINGFIIPAIIDTGAQITVMSESCAARCRLSESVDTRFGGTAIGVGCSRIIGQIRDLPLRVGPLMYTSKVSVLKDSRVDFIIGLDFLRRFRCELSVRDNLLKIQVRGRTLRVPFTSKNNHHHNYENSNDQSNISAEDTIKLVHPPVEQQEEEEVDDGMEVDDERITTCNKQQQHHHQQSDFERNCERQRRVPNPSHCPSQPRHISGGDRGGDLDRSNHHQHSTTSTAHHHHHNNNNKPMTSTTMSPPPPRHHHQSIYPDYDDEEDYDIGERVSLEGV